MSTIFQVTIHNYPSVSYGIKPMDSRYTAEDKEDAKNYVRKMKKEFPESEIKLWECTELI